MEIKHLPPLDANQRYSVPETAAYLRVSRAYVYQKIARGELAIIKDGSRSYVPGGDIILQSRVFR